MVEKNLYPLSEFTSAESFKSFEELQMRLDKVVGQKSEHVSKTSDETPTEAKKEEEDAVPAPGESEDEEDQTFFKNLREEGKSKGKK